ncbi:MAG: helicase [Acidobacteria bacterium]|nr:MAG: helicase [Acidobacteriota bacterium]
MTVDLPREHLIRALEADLVGPFHPDDREELLPLPPSRWYLTGFLAPLEGRELVEPIDDEVAAGPDDDQGAGDDPPAEGEPKRKSLLPSSIGLSAFLPAAEGTETLTATVRWAEYEAEEKEDEGDGPGRFLWRRRPRGPLSADVPLDAAALERGIPLPGCDGVELCGKLESAAAPGLPEGARALALFVVNRRGAGEPGREDERFLFQVALELTYERGFLGRTDRHDEASGDQDARVADLQFRQRLEHAVGHGVSVIEPRPQADGRVTRVQTTWLPRTEIPLVTTAEVDGVTVGMDALSELRSDGEVRQALDALPAAYEEWIAAQAACDVGASVRRRETRDRLVAEARRAAARIREGIDLVAAGGDAQLAFRLANRAMAEMSRRRRPDEEPRWRLFQLAFLLLTLPSITDPHHRDHETVELIFFPTGGGKTEAYLGVIAYALLLRRLRGRERPDRGLGVAVLLRYTLRLLTLDQLERAATLICALECLRRERTEELGRVRFAVGLWVGRSATANTLAEVKKRIDHYKSSSSRGASSPCPLTRCPWCGKELGRGSLAMAEDGSGVVLSCANFHCDFTGSAADEEGLPVLFVDEQIYREPPAFLIATVDKLAMLPWRGETGTLFGRIQALDGRFAYGPLDRIPPAAQPLPDGLRPPELIVQDELHLISGPLGTLAGLYETAVETLATRRDGERPVRPKILASTATVRHARAQLAALFARHDMALFPPPGIDEGETFFATRDRSRPGRLYLGVAAPGRAFKAPLLRVYVALLGAAQYVHRAGRADDADGYLTLAGYFNSLRELGGMRRLVEDEVRTRCARIEDRRPLSWQREHPWMARRRIQAEPVELTSREPTTRIARSKARLALPYSDDEHVDVLLASNMISVGIDIDRLGLMVVAGQPKSTAEYIQATSRVGRDPRWPGLVVTCLNVHRPRDRSHFEHFAAYHHSFYRFVETTSLTPFAGPALDRGLAGTLVAIARLADPALTPPQAAMAIAEHRAVAESALEALLARAAAQPTPSTEALVEDLRQRGRQLIDAWERLVRQAREGAGQRCYSPFDVERRGKPLLHTVLDPEHRDDDERRFVAPTSMRDVEPSVHLWAVRRLGGDR